MRFAIALALALHGLIHLIGFVVPWRLAEIRGFAYSTSAAWGRIQLGDAGARAIGLAWLMGSLAFVLAAAAVWQGAARAVQATAIAAALSALLCLAGSPAAVADLVIDILILMGLLVAHWTGWLARVGA